MAHQFLAKLSAEFIVQTGQLTRISSIPTEFLWALLGEHSGLELQVKR